LLTENQNLTEFAYRKIAYSKEKDIAKTKFAYSNSLQTGKLCFQQRRIA
jgi:hypothetical protein